MILVTSYVNPDLDGSACALAYSAFLKASGKNAEAGLFGVPHKEALWCADYFGVKIPVLNKDNLNKFQEFIVVDMSDKLSLPQGIAPDKVIGVIDHRLVYDKNDFPNAHFDVRRAGACASLVAGRFYKTGINLSSGYAAMLCGAIISNSQNFYPSCTTPLDKEMFSWLKSKTNLPPDFVSLLFEAKSDIKEEEIPYALANDMKIFEVKGKKVGIAQLEILRAQEFFYKYEDKIKKELDKLKGKNKLNIIFLNLVDIGENFSIIFADDDVIQQIVKSAYDINFTGSFGKSSEVIMRKYLTKKIYETM